MEIRFAAERLEFGISRGGYWDSADCEPSSPFWLTGFACPYVDDRYSPPPEWKFLNTGQIRAIERRPLEADVKFLSDEAWKRRHIYQDVSSLDKWPVGEHDATVDPELVKSILHSNAASATESNATVYYCPPAEPDQYFSLGDRDAALEISLRMSRTGLERWNEFGKQFVGVAIPPCTVTLSEVLFAIDDAASAKTGSPTWARFVEGRMVAPALAGFSLRVSFEYEKLAFDA
jgi:hypothetical protein